MSQKHQCRVHEKAPTAIGWRFYLNIKTMSEFQILLGTQGEALEGNDRKVLVCALQILRNAHLAVDTLFATR